MWFQREYSESTNCSIKVDARLLRLQRENKHPTYRKFLNETGSKSIQKIKKKLDFAFVEVSE